jgi:thiamine biosynthesis lipoprotein
MDTYVTITAFAPQALAQRALDAAFARLEEISRKFNHLDSTSVLYAFNERNEPITDTEVVHVLRVSNAVSRLSGGAFDVTVEPLIRLWGFYGGTQKVPEQRQIDSCLAMVGYQKLAIENGRVTKRDPRVRVDCGGIAKGYGLVEAARVMRLAGVDSALIDLGGDVYAVGRKGDRRWKVAVRSPRSDGVVGVVEVSNLAVVTSGDYERFFFGPDSVRYCHILNPHTGRPARGYASATVLMRDPLVAQGVSKVLFILGPETMKLSDSAHYFEAMLVTDSLRAILSPGLAGMMRLTEPGGVPVPQLRIPDSGLRIPATTQERRDAR